MLFKTREHRIEDKRKKTHLEGSRAKCIKKRKNTPRTDELCVSAPTSHNRIRVDSQKSELGGRI